MYNISCGCTRPCTHAASSLGFRMGVWASGLWGVWGDAGDLGDRTGHRADWENAGRIGEETELIGEDGGLHQYPALGLHQRTA